MSSTEPPAGSTPPPGEPTPPPPAPEAVVPPPPNPSTVPPPPPPPAGAAAPMPGAPVAAYGPGQPGNLVDRFLAKLIDFVIVGVVYWIVVILVGAVLITGYRSGGELFVYWLIISVISAVVFLGYFAYMESSRGQTVGKTVMKLKTFGPDGVSNPTMEQAVRRNIWLGGMILGIIPIVGPFLGWLVILAGEILCAVGINGDTVKRQHWFDTFAGGTQVMKIG
jgi:uncharacterized RDD family membrane protein YckC